MKHWAVVISIIFLIFVSACRDEQKQFCTKAVTTLCGRCDSCGGDFRQCGLTRAKTVSECIETLEQVCASYDSIYSQEVSQTCLERLTQLTCDRLKTEGKPEICTRLF